MRVLLVWVLIGLAIWAGIKHLEAPPKLVGIGTITNGTLVLDQDPDSTASIGDASTPTEVELPGCPLVNGGKAWLFRGNGTPSLTDDELRMTGKEVVVDNGHVLYYIDGVLQQTVGTASSPD